MVNYCTSHIELLYFVVPGILAEGPRIPPPLFRQYFVACLCYQDLAFPLRRGQPIVRQYSPAVGFVDVDIVSSHVNHGLDGEGHARDNEHAGSPFSEMLDIGFLMEFHAATVSA